ncbi:hypothetical protein JW916_15425 [Candidatus Sumerlaeota bacterium]|nr:hypothetical protein [Candidatus Sumerlaeota bacterium]
MTAFPLAIPLSGTLGRIVARFSVFLVLFGLTCPGASAADAPESDSAESSARPQIVHTDIGPVYRLAGSSFRADSPAKTNKERGALEFPETGGAAETSFDLLDSGDYAVCFLTRGPTGPMVFDLDGLEVFVPRQKPTGADRRSVVYAGTDSLFASGNSLSIRCDSGGVLEAVVISEPLFKLRELAARYASLEVQRRMLLQLLREEKRAAVSVPTPTADPTLANHIAALDGPLAGYMREWRADYMALHRDYAKVYADQRPESLAPRRDDLTSRLNGVEGQLTAVRGKKVSPVVLDPANYRVSMQEALRRESFEDFPWIVLRTSQIDVGDTYLDLLKVLGIDSLMADLRFAGNPRILERLESREIWCIFSREAPFRGEWNSGRDFDLSETDSRALPDLWRADCSSGIETYVNDTYPAFAQSVPVLGFAYWPNAEIDLGPENAASAGEDRPALRGAWDLFRLGAEDASGAPKAPRAASEQPSSGTLPAAEIQGRTFRTSPLRERILWDRFLEQSLSSHFQTYSRALASVAGNKPRLGLFSSPKLGPKSPAPSAGLSGYGLLAETGFPAFGLAAQGDTARLAYAHSLSRFDPARRPIWESLYRLESVEKESAAAEGRLRRDFARTAFWGLTGIVLDPGPTQTALFEGPVDAGLVREAMLELPVLKRSLLVLGGVLKKTRVADQRIALLEPGVWTGQGGDSQTALEPWLEWFKKERYAPLWVPRELLAKESPAAKKGRSVFDGYRILAAPGPLVLSDSTANRLLEWVKNGGILFTTDPVGYFTPDGEAMSLFLDFVGAAHVTGSPGQWTIARGVQPNPKIQILATDALGAPNILLIPVENGHLLVALGNAHRSTEWARKMSRTAAFVFPVPPLRASAEADDIELLLRQSDRGERFLLALNPSLSRAISSRVEVGGKYSAVFDVTYGKPLPLRFETLQDAVRVVLTLDPGEARVLKLNPPPRSRTKASP